MSVNAEPRSNRPPARLHVLISRDQSTGLVIRRGPTRHVCTIGWDLATDRFDVGQWMNGRIYEKCCDLSPDGRLLLYFAMGRRWSRRGVGARTAISRTPFLKALSLWPKGDCWNGGGLFIDDETAWISGWHAPPIVDESGVTIVPEHDLATNCVGEDPVVRDPRMLRDGWLPISKTAEGRTLVKPLGNGWSLRKFCPHRGYKKLFYAELHELVRPDGTAEPPEPEWLWADVVGGRVLWAVAGEIRAATIERDGIGPVQMLLDTNPLEFEAIEAPY